MPNKTFAITDIHGQYNALMQCLERSGFDYENDTLISLGDLVDRGRNSFLVVEELLKIKNLIAIRGNHDQVFQHWLNTGVHQFGWRHGGEETRISYKLKGESWSKLDELGIFNLMTYEIPQSHKNFFNNQCDYYIDSKNRLFIHGGFNRDYPLIEQDINTFAWDRKLWNKAMSCKGEQKLVTLEGFNEIYIGHSPTTEWTELINDDFENKKMVSITHPMYSGGVWNLDTGAGYSNGKLSIMNIDTKQIFQSDLIEKIY